MMKALATTVSSAIAGLGWPRPRLPAKRPDAPAAEAPADIGALLRGPTRFGLAVAFAFFALFGGWAATAPLSSGAIAPGIVSPSSNRKVIQHLEGGIIHTIHVQEGQRVAAGDPLVTLESTRAEATFTAREEEQLRLLVLRARLDAQAQDRGELMLPPEAASIENAELTKFIESQQTLLESRQTALRQEEEIHQRRIEQLLSEIASIEAETDGMAAQIGLLDTELAAKEELLDEQLISQSAVLQLQRERARLESAMAANAGRVARANQSIEETRLALLQARERYRDQVAEESTQVNNQLAQLDEELVSSGDSLRRRVIASPVDGIVLNLRNQTPGGVIRPGDTIMDVVPVDDDMIIVARLQPKDIDLMQVGLPAHVTLVPFASRNDLPLEGEVTQVAADSTLDEATRQYYYEIRVRVGIEELAKHEGYYLAPGMPADVTIVTGERTMLQYLLDPFVRSIRSAFVYD